MSHLSTAVLKVIRAAGLGFLFASLGIPTACRSAEIFAEAFDGGPALPSGWTTSVGSGGGGWSLRSGNADTPPNCLFATESIANSDAWLTSPPILISTPGSRLRFRHSYGTTSYYSRGWLEISISGEPFNDFLAAGGFFLTNGYSHSFYEGWRGFTAGFISTEAYLPPAAAGQTIRLRWRFLTEYGGGGGIGWLVDTISISDGLPLPPDDLSVSLSASPNLVAIGSDLNYLIKLTNTGPTTATAVLLTNLLPAGVTLVSSTPSVGTCSNIGGTIVCGFGNVAGQSGATLTVVVRPTANGVLTNRVLITRGEPDVYLLNNTAAITTIVATPALYAANVSVVEGDSGVVNVGVAVSLLPASPQIVTVNYTTTNGSAIAGSDYSSRSGTLTFNPGETLKTVTVPVLGDALDETNETFFLHLSDPANAVLAAAVGVATIIDDDDPPSLVVLDAMVVEGNSGTTYALFPMFLTAPSGRTVSVDFYTGNGSATEPQDFLATNGTADFPPGTTSQTIAVRVTGDTIPEENEYFSLQMQNLVNANLFNSAQGWILNDDGLPGQLHHFSWSGMTSSTFVGQPLNVTLTAQDYFNNTVTNFTSPVAFSATTIGGSAVNTLLNAPTPNDSYSYPQTAGYAFTPNTNLVLTHVRHYSGSRVSLWTDEGTLILSQPVTGVQATWTETELTSPVQLSAGVRYRVAVHRGTQALYQRYSLPPQFDHGTIDLGYWSYDDVFPQNTSSALWLVDLRYAVGSLQAVPISPASSSEFVGGVWSGNLTPLADGTAVRLLAEDGQGHTGFSDPFDVLVMNDVWLNISATPDPVGVGANLAYLVTVTNSGPSAATGLTLTNFLPAGVTFLSASSSQGNITNLAGTVVCNLGTLPSAAAATATINVLVGGVGTLTNLATVTRAEPDFTLANNLATLVTTVMAPALTVENASAVEGNAGTVPMIFNVRLSPISGQTVSVNYATANGTANSGSDYTSTSGTLFFTPGQTHQTVTVPVNGDFLNETDETIFLNLFEPTNATLVLTQAVGRILNDDPLPALLIYGASVNEGDIGSTTALFTVTLTAPSSQPVSVGYEVYDGSARQPTDYVFTNGVLQFPPGVTTQVVAVTVNGDTSVENTETFGVYFYSLENATYGNSSATGFIVNDDGLPGQLHHFSWAAINSPQSPAQPLAVTVTAQDYFDHPASNFTGLVSLSAQQVVAETTGAILGSPAHSASDTYGPYTLGYAFTPGVDLLVTHVRHYFGSKVSIWTDDGNLLASQSVSSTPGTWKETALSAPVWLLAGTRYRVGVYTAAGNRYWRFDGSSAFNHGTIDQGYYAYEDNFPQNYDSARWWFVDLRYVVQTRQPVALSPTVTPNFVGGQWSGSLSVLGSGSAIALRADDNLGHFGLSNPFDLTGVRLGITAAGGNVLLSWPSVMTGFVLESTADLSDSPTWEVITNTPTIIGDQIVITNSASERQSFFRLRTP